jgi:hypothetical protein
MQHTISIDTVPYIEFVDFQPSIGACVFIGDSEALGECTIPFQQVLQEFIGAHLVGDTISGEDREMLLDILLGFKVVIKEATKQVKNYGNRDMVLAPEMRWGGK